MFIFKNFSTCFGHHYAHLQENKTSCSPEDGHNDARNMLRIVKNKHQTAASCWFSLSLHNLLTMHGHGNLKISNFVSLLKGAAERNDAEQLHQSGVLEYFTLPHFYHKLSCFTEV